MILASTVSVSDDSISLAINACPLSDQLRYKLITNELSVRLVIKREKDLHRADDVLIYGCLRLAKRLVCSLLQA